MDKYEALYEAVFNGCVAAQDGTIDQPVIELTEDPGVVFLNYKDGSSGSLRWRNGQWESSEPYYTDAATATGMYDHW